jgi:hypothetical protein
MFFPRFAPQNYTKMAQRSGLIAEAIGDELRSACVPRASIACEQWRPFENSNEA